MTSKLDSSLVFDQSGFFVNLPLNLTTASEKLYAMQYGRDTSGNVITISLLHTATSAGHQNIVKMLLEYNATIDYSLDNRAGHREGETALHFAAADNQPECAQVLLQYGADWKKMTSGGMTALHLASGLGHIHFIKTLLPVAGQEWYGCFVVVLSFEVVETYIYNLSCCCASSF